MKTKEGVKLEGLKIVMREVLIIADRIWRTNGQELVITSTTDGVHSPGSLHPYGYAVDLRIRYFEKNVQIAIADNLREELGQKYRVILHNTHIHIEYRQILLFIGVE